MRPAGAFGRLGRRALLGSLAALGCALAVPPVAAEPDVEGATAFAREVGEEILAVLEDGASDREAKLARLVALLDKAADLPLVARLVLGRYWREASPSQRQTYVDLFQSLVIKTMAERLNRYGGETFTVLGARAADERDTVVATRITRAGQAAYTVEWRVREDARRFAVVDIVVEGISLVITQRAEVNEVVARRGVEGLIAVMRERLNSAA